jgi:hypothetical protein
MLDWAGPPLSPMPSGSPGPLCLVALALFLLAGWASQEQFPAIFNSWSQLTGLHTYLAKPQRDGGMRAPPSKPCPPPRPLSAGLSGPEALSLEERPPGSLRGRSSVDCPGGHPAAQPLLPEGPTFRCLMTPWSPTVAQWGRSPLLPFLTGLQDMPCPEHLLCVWIEGPQQSVRRGRWRADHFWQKDFLEEEALGWALC